MGLSGCQMMLLFGRAGEPMVLPGKSTCANLHVCVPVDAIEPGWRCAALHSLYSHTLGLGLRVKGSGFRV